MQKLVILLGFEVSQVKQKPITDIITWEKVSGSNVSRIPRVHPRFNGSTEVEPSLAHVR